MKLQLIGHGGKWPLKSLGYGTIDIAHSNRENTAMRKTHPSPSRLVNSICANKYIIFLFLTIIYCILTLYPLLQSGFYSDDMVNSLLKSQLRLGDTSLWEHTRSSISHWLVNGRLTPIFSVYSDTISFLLADVFLYKLFILCMIVLNIVLFGLLVLKLSGTKNISILSIAAIPVFFQFRLYHDPILSFSGFQQFLLLLFLSATLFFIKYQRSGRKIHLLASLVIFNLALYSYETSSLSLFVFMFLVADHNGYRDLRRMLRQLTPFLISVFVMALLLVVIRSSAPPSNYDGINPGFDFSMIGKTFLIQFSAALPLSYFLFNPSNLFFHDLGSIAENVTIVDLCLGVFLAITLLTFGNVKVRNREGARLSLIGLILWSLHALTIALSHKYQQELSANLGLGYTPVYIEYFAALMSFLGLYSLISNKIENDKLKFMINGILLTMITAAAIINMQNNRKVVDKSNIDIHYKRLAIEKALRSGLLNDVPENSELYVVDDSKYDPYPYVKSVLKDWVDGVYHWKNEALFYQYSGRKFKIHTNRKGILSLLKIKPELLTNFYRVKVYSAAADTENNIAAVRIDKFNEQLVHELRHTFTACQHSNGMFWQKGINIKTGNQFFMTIKKSSPTPIHIGERLEFKNAGVATIIAISRLEANGYSSIFVIVDKQISPEGDGYPNPIRILGTGAK